MNDEPHRIMENCKDVSWQDFVDLVLSGEIFAMKIDEWNFIDVFEDVAYDLKSKTLRDKNCSQRILFKEEFNKNIHYVNGVWYLNRQIFDTEETGEMIQGIDGYEYPDTRKLKTFKLRSVRIVLLTNYKK